MTRSPLSALRAAARATALMGAIALPSLPSWAADLPAGMAPAVKTGTAAATSPITAIDAATVIAAPPPASSATGTAWSPSWIAPPQALWSGDFALPTLVPFQFRDQTVRQSLRLSVGGERLRVEFSNEYGSTPLRIDAATVARPAAAAEAGAGIIADSLRTLRFGGATSVAVPPGARVVSDPVDLPVRALERLSISLYLPGPVAPSTFHWEGRDTAYVAAGRHVADTVWPDGGETMSPRVFLAGVRVERRGPPATVVTIGDSITDGNGSTPGADRRWPDRLAEWLAPRGVAVLNAGISGGRLLSDGMGPSALARLQRDVLGQPGIRAVIVLLGTNDIGYPQGPFSPDETPMTAERLIAGLRLLIEQSHAANVRVIGGTIPPNEQSLAGTPFEGHHSAAKDRVRQDVNRWIRTSGAFDGVVDVDALLRDPKRPSRLASAWDSGDHLHPGDAGYAAMADAIDLARLLGE
ncbi:SGNH/GDSL hydrolase family protein [Roseateles chitosanitabidus]|uniref:SGNH/GDSL hydrolase family protein n=1 Tax=Roseateles chitosanitabidus TaxID=65048 RepID=UPI002352F182|nr:SGNH/GDSL hydrolase family protein [Roseateles chitosanitabidus]